MTGYGIFYILRCIGIFQICRNGKNRIIVCEPRADREKSLPALKFIRRETKTMKVKEMICTAAGLTGGCIAKLFGGWDSALVTLIIFMIVDYLSGLVVAGVFHKSKKSENGALDSKAGWKGLCKKGMALAVVLIAYRLDLALGLNFIRNAVIIGFMANELISIVENAGLMGVPLPAVINKAIDILTTKANTDGDQ